MEIFSYQFMLNALIGIFISSVLCGIVGSLIVVNRIVSLAGSIAHAAYGGVGIAFYFGLPVQLITMLFSSISGLIIAKISENSSHRSDSYIGILWASGMALGIILIDLTPGYNADIMTYLFGNILTITSEDLIISFLILLITLFVIIIFYNRILILSFDKEYAMVMGYNVRLLNYVIYVLISVSIVILIRMTGIIMIMAMLTIPQNIAIKRSKSLFSMMVISSILVIFFSLLGFFFAYKFDLSTGATIIIFSALIYLLDSVYLYAKKR
ncbi:MAG: metal ABC transporter permease [Calditerrivibrio sp.]|nr:metal ABC transporter permease [Calditerrivibrio sp.]MCA1932887.1 metal ABC transporter permease [Calditerrivibrio sp.]MCA1979945.1 metal ABC transporter permease [Calditerrivibrio sp.]